MKSIFSKLLIISLLIFVIPIGGYEYLKQTRDWVKVHQEDALVEHLNILSERIAKLPEFEQHVVQTLPDKLFYAHTLPLPIRLDGYLNDWSDYRDQTQYFPTSSPTSNRPVEVLAGLHDDFLYLSFYVLDSEVVYVGERSQGGYDHIMLRLQTKEGRILHYPLATESPGWLASSAELLDPRTQTMSPFPLIRGEWQEHAQGYQIEVKIPLTEFNARFAFEVNNFAENASKPVWQIRFPDSKKTLELANIIGRSRGLEQQLLQLLSPGQHGWITDRYGNIIAYSAQKAIEPSAQTSSQRTDWSDEIVSLLKWVFDITQAQGPAIGHSSSLLLEPNTQTVLEGKAISGWRLNHHHASGVLSAGHPIFQSHQVVAGLFIQESAAGLMTFQYMALARIIGLSLVIFLIIVIALLLFSYWLVFRIRRLKEQISATVDQNGKVIAPLSLPPGRDELGELGYQFSEMTEKLQAYHQYLEKLGQQINHELRTPIAVVSSSLDNLQTFPLTPEAQKYCKRALEGNRRLSKILAKLSEASRLQQALAVKSEIDIDLSAILHSLFEAYQESYPEYHFVTDIQHHSANIQGDSDSIAQLVDKLVENAVEFSKPGGEIVVRLVESDRYFIVDVENHGVLLPPGPHSRLFDSMVSLRNKPGHSPHLGLGLYIARMIVEAHHGQIKAENLEDQSGVGIRIIFPKCPVY